MVIARLSHRHASLGMLGLAVLVLAGCGRSDDGPQTVLVSGSVVVDGSPLPKGDILFRDTSAGAATYAGKIENGAFSFETTPGTKRVEITARRQVPGKFREDNPGERTPVEEQFIPATYNTATTLEANVADGGGNDFEFTIATE